MREKITLDEAIRDLRARVDGEFYIEGVDDCADMKLGIEALKRVRNNRGNSFPVLEQLLPGETKE